MRRALILPIATFTIVLISFGCKKSHSDVIPVNANSELTLSQKQLIQSLSDFNSKFKTDHPEYFNVNNNQQAKGKFWKWLGGIFGGLLADAIGGLIGYGVGDFACGPACGYVGAALNGLAWSFLVADWIINRQDPFDSIRTTSMDSASVAIYYDYPYDSTFIGRSNSNNPYDSIGIVHNMMLDSIFKWACYQRTNHFPITNSNIYWQMKNNFGSLSSIYKMDTANFFSENDLKDLIDNSDLAEYENLSGNESDTSIYVNFITRSDTSSLEQHLFLEYMRTGVQITTFSGLLSYTKGVEDVIYSSTIDNSEKEKLLIGFAIGRASLIYWYNVGQLE